MCRPSSRGPGVRASGRRRGEGSGSVCEYVCVCGGGGGGGGTRRQREFFLNKTIKHLNSSRYYIKIF